MSTATLPAERTTAVSAQDKFILLRTELTDSLIERASEVDIVMTALIAREHALFVGPPGLGKSLLANRLCDCMSFAGDPFEIILSKFTEPDELYGPIGLAAYKAGTNERITDGMLPTARVAFVDECFNGSSAILNTMLPVMNERKFRNGKGFVDCPLDLMIGATNQYPGGEGSKELGALFDRFMLRSTVRPIQSAAGMDRLLWDDLSFNPTYLLSEKDLVEAQDEARAIVWMPDAKEAFTEILHSCRRSGIQPGDRRVRKCINLIQSFAWLEGEIAVTTDHLGMLANCLWVDPAEQPREVLSIVKKVAAPAGLIVNGLLMEVDQIMAESDMKDMPQLLAACKKLGEVHRKVKKLNGELAENAEKQVAATIADLRTKSVEMAL